MSRDRLLFNEDGKTLDEIVFTGMMHLEQEDDDAYYLAVYEGDRHAMFNLYAEPYLTTDDEENPVVRVRLIVSERDVDHSLFPVRERHKTKEEWDATQGRTDWYVPV